MRECDSTSVTVKAYHIVMLMCEQCKISFHYNCMYKLPISIIIR